MSIPTLILGTPGTGKSTSMRNMDPAQTLLIQCVKKPLPFRAKGWSYLDRATRTPGNIILCDDAAMICDAMRKTSRKVICLDDSNYVMSNAFMRRATETGYQKFTEMAQGTFGIFETAANLAADVRVYIFAHTQQTEDGVTRFKTVGKLLDEKVSLDGLVTICLKTVVHDGQYYFATRNNGSDTVKSPMGMFEEDLIENDLAMIDKKIAAYYELTTA
jgi:hypothetical protein